MENPETISEHQTPTEALAALIVEKLAEAELISSARKVEVQRKLKNGTAKQDDWRLWIELALEEKDRKEENDGKD